MINLTNYNEHPTRLAHTVFHFFNKERASYFESLLAEQDIWFESEIDNQTGKTTYFFGVKNRDLKKVQQINYLVSAKFRKRTISNKYIVWVLYLFIFLTTILVILGYLNSRT